MPSLTNESRWMSYIKLSKLEKKKKPLVHRVLGVMSVILRNTHQDIPGHTGSLARKARQACLKHTNVNCTFPSHPNASACCISYSQMKCHACRTGSSNTLSTLQHLEKCKGPGGLLKKPQSQCSQENADDSLQ